MIPVHCFFTLVLQQAGLSVLPCLAVIVGENLQISVIEGVKSNFCRGQSEEDSWDEGKTQRPLGIQRNMLPSIFLTVNSGPNFLAAFMKNSKLYQALK